MSEDTFYTPEPWDVEPTDEFGTYRLRQAAIEQRDWTIEGYGEMETAEEEAEGERRNQIAILHDAGNARLMQEAVPMFKALKRLLADLEDFSAEDGEFEFSKEAGWKMCREIEEVLKDIELV